MMEEPMHKPMDHQPPHWVRDDAIFFITVCAEPRGLNQFCHTVVGMEILKTIRHYHEREGWFCHLVVLMPDHIHLLLSFPDIPSFARPIGEWKKWLVKRHGISWQENFFDHRLRREESLGEKADYILQNPVRAGLVKEAKDWPYTWMSEVD
jgi:putative transposase